MKVFLSILVVIVIVAVVLGILYMGGDEKPQTSPSATAAGSASPAATGNGIVLNEFMALNKGVNADETGEYCDWAEIYNPTAGPVDLNGYALSDDDKQLNKWAFPNISVAPQGYVVVFLSGKSYTDTDNGIIHATFKLNADGDKIILSNLAGEVVDGQEFKSMPANQSMGRVGDEWKLFDRPTPGFENSDAGYEAFRGSMAVGDPPLRISEAMTSNNITLADNSGAYNDWVEIVNVSDQDVSLEGMGLSDRPDDPMKWRFPGIALKSGEHLVVFCSGDQNLTDKDYKKGLHCNFRLASYKETIVLSDARGRTLDSVAIENVPADNSYARVYENGKPGDTWKQTGKATPGYPNTDEGYGDFSKNNQLALGDIVISEVLASNSKIDFEGDGKTCDFIEIANRGEETVQLQGYGLTTNTKNPASFRFPETALSPGQAVVVLASSDYAGEEQKKKYLHAPFGVSAQGEMLALFDAEDRLVDKCCLDYSPPDVSVGRGENESDFSYYTEPTPGQANGGGSAGIAGDVAADRQPGVYEDTVEVTLSAPEGCEIYYTTEDGLTPTQKSKKYAGPLTIGKTTALRARAYREGYLPGRTMTATYFIEPGHSLPLLSVVTDSKYLFDPETGIYMEGPNASDDPAKFKEGANYYQDTEIPVSFEVFDKNGKRAFNQDVAMKMAGGLGLMKAQKSFAVYARSQYGKSTMAYPFFENRPFTEYKSLSIRQVRDQTKIKEATILSLVDGKIKLLSQACKPYVVYINGRYWGAYYLMEKRNKYMIAAHEGIEDPDAMNIQRGTAILQKGSNESYKKLRQYVLSHDMTQKKHYDYVAARLDTDGFMDVMINQVYIGNTDTYNMQSYQLLPDGKWKQILVDVEITFQIGHKTLKARMNDAACNSDVLNGLLKYKPWRNAFIERFAWTIREIYNTERVTAAIDKAADDIRGEIAAMHERFGDTATLDKWESAVDAMYAFAKQRPADMVRQLKEAFSLTDAQEESLDDALK